MEFDRRKQKIESLENNFSVKLCFSRLLFSDNMSSHIHRMKRRSNVDKDELVPLEKRIKSDYVNLVAGIDQQRYLFILFSIGLKHSAIRFFSRFPVDRQTMIESSKYFEVMLGPNC